MRRARGRGGRPAVAGGFTLVELLVGIVIFSVVILGAGGVFMALVRGDRDSRARTTTAFELQERIERLYETPYEELADGSAEEPLAAGGSLTVEWDVTEVVPGTLAQVDVRTYGSGGAGHGERAVRFFIANRAP